MAKPSNQISLDVENGSPDESRLARMFRKMKKDPAVAIGMAGWTGFVGYGLYNIRNRKMKLSVYLIHLRVKAQVFAVGCMTLAVVYNIYNETMKRRQNSITDSTVPRSNIQIGADTQ